MLTRLISTFILSLADLFLTLRLVDKYGLDVEANPLGRWILSEPWRIVVFKVLLIAIALVVLWIFRERTAAKVGSWTVFIAYMALLLYHISLLIMYK